MRKIISIFVFCLLFGGLINCQQTLSDKAKEYLRPVVVPAPLDNPTTKEKIELGKMLFFDPRMSGSNWISCATCHNPALGWSDGLSLGFGHDMKPLSRNTPTILNTAYQTHQFWDGRAETLEEQALGPVESSAEMSQDITVMIGELEELSVYKNLFDIAFPKEGLTKVNIAKALAAYERTIVSGESPFDRYLKGNLDEIDVSAKRGFVLFENKAQCSKCHSGFNFSDNGFHNIGLKDPNGNIDEGRWGAIGKDAPIKIRALVGAFKTPTLRDVALTAPYMHNGMYKTLEEVVDHYDRGGDDLEYLDPNMIKLKLTSEEKKDLVSFLKTLTGEQIQVVLPNLPQN
ncbi:MAG: c-type cytochrome [Leptospiraceae bacterium]|jgi:cytochrome c peroxidase|nr:c-type cytochrome [Leptospiraceae bacterium]MCZ8348218.1 c-type cytochrome [Leptospiraceae bacterium]